MNINQIMKQAQEMQKKAEQAQEKLAKSEYEHEVNQALKVKVNGNKEVLKLEIDKDLLEPDNKEVLEDMIVVAFNEVFKKVDEDTNEVMAKATGNLNIPGLF